MCFRHSQNRTAVCREIFPLFIFAPFALVVTRKIYDGVNSNSSNYFSSKKKTVWANLRQGKIISKWRRVKITWSENNPVYHISYEDYVFLGDLKGQDNSDRYLCRFMLQLCCWMPDCIIYILFWDIFIEAMSCSANIKNKIEWNVQQHCPTIQYWVGVRWDEWRFKLYQQV